MRTAPAGWRAIVLYTLFDLRNLVRNSSLWQVFLLPLLLLPLLGGQVWLMMGVPALTASDVLVVTDDPELGEALTRDLPGIAWTVEVVSSEPADLEDRLKRGETDIGITLDPDFSTNGQAQVRTGKGTSTQSGTQLHDAMIEALLQQRVLTRAGPPPDVVYEHAPPPSASGTSHLVQDLATSSAPAHALGLWAIGFFGLGIGAILGPALSTSLRERFNYVLAVGTPALDIYRSELLTTSLAQGAQSMAWWAMYAAAGLIAGGWFGLELPTQQSVLQGLPLLVVLAPAAIIQMTGLSMLVMRTLEDAPSEVRNNIGVAVLMPMFALSSVARGVGLHKVATLAALPVLGPVALWSYRLSALAAPEVLLPWQALLLVQLVWTVLALRLGAWVFVLDETPLTWARRRWRRA